LEATTKLPATNPSGEVLQLPRQDTHRIATQAKRNFNWERSLRIIFRCPSNNQSQNTLHAPAASSDPIMLLFFASLIRDASPFHV
jgi:hypothetical protein